MPVCLSDSLSFLGCWARASQLFGQSSSESSLVRSYFFSLQLSIPMTDQVSTLEDDPALPPLLFSLFATARGFGNLSSGIQDIFFLVSFIADRANLLRTCFQRTTQVLDDARFARRIRDALCEPCFDAGSSIDYSD